MSSYSSANAYALDLAEHLTTIDLQSFFTNVHNQFYPKIDISFMEYFLELNEHEGEFIVKHDKLVEYGIMAPNQTSNKIRVKLNNLQLVENEDYLLADVRQQLSSGTKYSKVYTLTPDAFKTCLMRAQTRTSYDVNPIVYINYYLLLEKIFKLYTSYEKAYLERLISIKDKKIDHQCMKIDKLEQDIKELIERSDRTLTKLDETKQEVITVSGKLDNMTESMDSMHVDFTETAYHSTAVVKDCKQTYFALTSKSLEDGSVIFRAWRTQKERIFKVVSTEMSKDGQELIIPPMYVGGVVNIPIAAMSKIKLQLRDIADKHNKTTVTTRATRWSMTKLIHESNLELKYVKPIWIPNQYISRDDMIKSYLDVITETQGQSFEFEVMPDDFKEVVKQRKLAYTKRINEATGDTKKYLQAMADAIGKAQKLMS